MSEQFRLEVPAGNVPVRLDSFCTAALTALTRSQLKSGIREIKRNGKPVKLSRTVYPGDVITIVWENPVPDSLIPEPIPLDILFEDTDVITINKQAGMVTHPAAGNWTGTVVQALAHYRLHDSPVQDAFADTLRREAGLKNFKERFRMGIVHRLDKDTSGVLITARNEQAELFLKEAFKQRRAEKYYAALLSGIPEKKHGVIETSLFRDPRTRVTFAVSADLSQGKYARSSYKVIRTYGRYALTLFKIHTGRTHQIRLHARFIGCPVAGDPLYGEKRVQGAVCGLMLHAYRLIIPLPASKEKNVFTAPLPRRFRDCIRQLKRQQGV